MTGETMNETEQALTEAVAKAIADDRAEWYGEDRWRWENLGWVARGPYLSQATTAIAAVRQFDEQAALNCGHCTPHTDEIACACQIKERDDE